MDHANLVKRAAKWLEQKHSIVVTEMGSGCWEIPDAIGFRMGFSTLIECKTSRGDYYSDRRKPQSRMGDFRYFMTPPRLLEGLTITEGWGLLEVRGKVIRKIIEAPQIEEKDWRNEQQLLLSCFRRLGKPRAGVSMAVKYYSFLSVAGAQEKLKATLGVSRHVYAD